MRKNLERALALTLALILAAPLLPAARAAGPETIAVSSAADLELLARQCALDAWSRDKKILLTADVDLADREFVPIPTFGGEFDGQGHTITGLRITGSGSSMGLFRQVQAGGVVRDLTVCGQVSPAGSADRVGGLAGENRGAILGCAFRGTVRGERAVGGIVGRNEAGGEVSGCAVSGRILGSAAAGGVAGENAGALIKCASAASVNTASPDGDAPAQELSVDASLGQLTREGQPDLLSGHSDTGGVVGLTDGVVQSCTNTGSVGYPHVGYNVGGIAGRQRGYLSGCVNAGTVLGRKDVGGIAGQAEPDVTLAPGAQTLERLRGELNSLDGLISQALDGAAGRGDRISQRLEAMGRRTDEAMDHSQTLLEGTEDFVNGNVEEINSLSASVTEALDRLSPALDGLSDASERVTDLSVALSQALDALEDAGALGFDASAGLEEAAGRLEQAGGAMERAVSDLRAAAGRLQDAVIRRDPETERQALQALSDAFASLGAALSQGGEAASTLLALLRQALEELELPDPDGFPESGPLPDGWNPDLLPDLDQSEQVRDALERLEQALAVLTGQEAKDALERLSNALTAMGQAAGQAGESLRALAGNVELHWEALEDALGGTDSALGGLHAAAGDFSAAMAALENAVRGAGAAAGPLGEAVDSLRDASDIGGGIGWKLERSFEAMEEAVAALRRNGPVTLRPLGDGFRAAGDGLYAAVSGLSREMEGLRGDVDGARSGLGDDLRAVSRQLGVVSDLLLDAMTEVADGGAETRLISDSSDQDIAAVRQGKIAQCVNTGLVEGDRNVGGVAGAMSIEYDLDPEDDLERFSLGGTYETRAVLLENVNRGAVTAKKDCAGGLVGRMDLGAAAACENYGPVSSASGGCVGGVAGWSEASIRGCFAKCVLSGKEDVGGIAGWGTKIHDCRAIATIAAGQERLGAIAGSAELGGVTGNRFVDTGVAGIDNISYAGAAEPVDYAALCQESGLPAEFLSFTLTLTAQGETVAAIPFQYGQDLSRVPLPEAPEREGFYGRWPDFDVTGRASDVTVEAVYTPWAALVASEETERGLSVALAEGRFTEDAVLYVRRSGRTPPAEGGQVWEISLTGTDLSAAALIPLRLLGPAEGSGGVRRYADGQWLPVETQPNGQYLLLEMEGLSGVYCVLPDRKGPNLLVPAAAAGAGAALAMAALAARRRKKRAPAGGGAAK